MKKNGKRDRKRARERAVELAREEAGKKARERSREAGAERTAEAVAQAAVEESRKTAAEQTGTATAEQAGEQTAQETAEQTGEASAKPAEKAAAEPDTEKAGGTPAGRTGKRRFRPLAGRTGAGGSPPSARRQAGRRIAQSGPARPGGRLPARLPAEARELLRPALWLVLLMLASVLALSVLNIFTANRAAAERLKRSEALLRGLLPGAGIFTETSLHDDRADMIYAGYTEPDEETGETVLTGYCIQVRAYGFGGPFELLVGVDLDGAVAGVRPVSHNETVGRGDVIGASDFLGQFMGRSGVLAVGEGGNAVQAVSGATFSCRAVTEGVNQALAVAADILAGGAGEEAPAEEQPDETPDAAAQDAAPADASTQIMGEGDGNLAGNP